jgi:hypothetical protein|tara:strand:- start:251 stop:607 length:357 start_codon:yes stop_codon:yes gene_type:complete
MKKTLLFITLLFSVHAISYASFPVNNTTNAKTETISNVSESSNLLSPIAGNGKGMSIASMVCGITAIFFGGIVLGPLAIIFGAIGLKRDGRGMAITGLICGILASLWTILVIAAVLSL